MSPGFGHFGDDARAGQKPCDAIARMESSRSKPKERASVAFVQILWFLSLATIDRHFRSLFGVLRVQLNPC